MAVYKRSYKGYSGAITPEWSRFLILARYSFARISKSRFLTGFRIASLFFPLGCAGFIYLSHNLDFLTTMKIPAKDLIDINNRFFMFFLQFQTSLAFLLTAFVGPSLVAPDLANNALPLYLCRPFSRVEYIAGKMSVLVVLLSIITWIPGLILWGMQAGLAGWDWTIDNFWIAGSIFVGSLLAIAILSLLALAMSAWVKWRIAAGALILFVIFAGAGFGAAINEVMRTKAGTFLDMAQVLTTVWAQLFGREVDTGIGTFDAWIAVGVVCGLCLWLLSRRVRAFEVVR